MRQERIEKKVEEGMEEANGWGYHANKGMGEQTTRNMTHAEEIVSRYMGKDNDEIETADSLAKKKSEGKQNNKSEINITPRHSVPSSGGKG